MKDVSKTIVRRDHAPCHQGQALGKETGDLSALANPESVDNIPLITKK